MWDILRFSSKMLSPNLPPIGRTQCHHAIPKKKSFAKLEQDGQFVFLI